MLGQRNTINVWVSDRQGNWDLGWDIGDLDLAILIAYKLKMNWGARIRLIMVVRDEEAEEKARNFLSSLIQLARLPKTLIEVYRGDFREVVQTAPAADLNIFGLDPDLPYEFIREMSEKTVSSCVFVKDSGHESILA